MLEVYGVTDAEQDALVKLARASRARRPKRTGLRDRGTMPHLSRHTSSQS